MYIQARVCVSACAHASSRGDVGGILLSLGLEQKLTFSSRVVTAEFSKFAGILSAALSHNRA